MWNGSYLYHLPPSPDFVWSGARHHLASDQGFLGRGFSNVSRAADRSHRDGVGARCPNKGYRFRKFGRQRRNCESNGVDGKTRSGARSAGGPAELAAYGDSGQAGWIIEHAKSDFSFVPPPSLGGSAAAAQAPKAKVRSPRAEPLLTGLASFASANDYQSADSEASGEEDPDAALGNLMSRTPRPTGPSSSTTQAPTMAPTTEPTLEAAYSAAPWGGRP